jgi:acyl-CoA thioesterase-1
MPDSCNPHPEIVAFKFPLRHFKEALGRQRKIKIVAIGSSTTAGESGVIPYPHRLELALRDFGAYPGRMIDVINRGIGGQEAPEELARFECDVLNEQPTMVIWQVGTNAMFRRKLYDPRLVVQNITTGLGWLKQLPADVVLMDLQYAPALFLDDGKPSPQQEPDLRKFVADIAKAASKAEVNLFPRFALMEQWVTRDGIAIKDLINDSDHLHQTENGTACVSKALAAAIIAATDFHEVIA